MTKSPILLACAAGAYILFVATIMNLVMEVGRDKPDTFFAPVAVLSMLTLSAAVMAFLFFYQPLLLLLEGKKKEALNFFVKTVGVFGAITVVIWILLFSGLI